MKTITISVAASIARGKFASKATKLKMKYFALLLVLLVFSCTKKEEPMKPIIKDPHSYAEPEKAVITHLSWSATVDFETNIILAKATYQIKTAADAHKIVLDTKDLTILKVYADDKPALYAISGYQEHLGEPLEIEITPQTKTVAIEYQTSQTAEALQWLNPQQTNGKKYPFLFTQSQAILARSWVPVQDSPGIRFTYDATVKVPSSMMALMSAGNPTVKSPNGMYHFEMKQPIPAYLLALAVGDLEFASLGDRSGIYAEPGMLAAAASEFEDTEAMITAAEELYGPYQWERYDILLLPPSFPFGGMENPRLTFATPTILAGDKSLVSLIAHELAHSWSGNLVTNATWNDFWLNEGFTVYFEMRIMEKLYGKEYSEMLSLLALQDLRAEVAEIAAGPFPQDTKLKLDLKGRNPDDGVTTIAYDKGYYFLRSLEQTVGRAAFDTFVKNYFTSNAFRSMNTESFVDYMKTNLLEKHGITADPQLYNAWIYTEGLPENIVEPVSNQFTQVDAVINSWKAGHAIADLKPETAAWNSHQWVHFLRSVADSLSLDQMSAFDDAFGFTASGNSEITFAWLKHVIKSQYTPAYDRLAEFLIGVGRRKFLVPLYDELIKTEAGKQRALDIYEQARPNYHFVSVSSIDKKLNWSE